MSHEAPKMMENDAAKPSVESFAQCEELSLLFHAQRCRHRCD